MGHRSRGIEVATLLGRAGTLGPWLDHARSRSARLEREGMLWSGSGDRECIEALSRRRTRHIEILRGAIRDAVAIESGVNVDTCGVSRPVHTAIAVVRRAHYRRPDFCEERALTVPADVIALDARMQSRCGVAAPSDDPD